MKVFGKKRLVVFGCVVFVLLFVIGCDCVSALNLAKCRLNPGDYSIDKKQTTQNCIYAQEPYDTLNPNANPGDYYCLSDAYVKNEILSGLMLTPEKIASCLFEGDWDAVLGYDIGKYNYYYSYDFVSNNKQGYFLKSFDNPVNKEICDDVKDNDGDGKIDCADEEDCIFFYARGRGPVCCGVNDKMAHSAYGEPRDCCEANEEVIFGLEGSKYAEGKPTQASICCESEEKVTYVGDGEPFQCCEGSKKAIFGKKGTKYAKKGTDFTSVCCESEEKVSFTSDGYPTGCCGKGEKIVFGKKGTDFAKDGKTPSSVCCDSEENVSFSWVGTPWMCCSDGKKVIFGKGDYAKGKEKQTSVCCESEDKVSLVGGEPSKCCSENKQPIFGKGDYAKGKEKQTSVCCESEDKVVHTSDGFPYDCCDNNQKAVKSFGLESTCRAACCDDYKDCSAQCTKISDNQLGISFYDCVKEEGKTKGFCQFVNSQARDYNFGLYLDCVNVEKYAEKGGLCKEIRPQIVCSSGALGSICSSSKEGFDSISNRTCIENNPKKEIVYTYRDNMIDSPFIKIIEKESFEDKIIEKCPEDKVCVEHRKKEANDASKWVGEAKCESCPAEIDFGIYHSKYYLADGMEVRYGDKDESAETYPLHDVKNVQLVENITEVLARLKYFCKKCGTIQSIFLHDVFDNEPLVNQLFELNPKDYAELRGCVLMAVGTDCNFGTSSESGKPSAAQLKLSQVLQNASTLGGTDLTQGDRSVAGKQKLVNPKLYEIRDGKEYVEILTKSIYYLSNLEMEYPGFGSKVYQVNVIEGKIGGVGMNIEQDGLQYRLLAEMHDDLSPCESNIISEKVFDFDSNNSEIKFETLSIKALPETFSKDKQAKIRVRELSMNCLDYKNKKYPTQKEMNVIEEAYRDKRITKEYYEEYKKMFERKIECVADYNCENLPCKMGNLDCKYLCEDNKCLLEKEAIASRKDKYVKYCGSISLSPSLENDGLWDKIARFVKKIFVGEEPSFSPPEGVYACIDNDGKPVENGSVLGRLIDCDNKNIEVEFEKVIECSKGCANGKCVDGPVCVDEDLGVDGKALYTKSKAYLCQDSSACALDKLLKMSAEEKQNLIVFASEKEDSCKDAKTLIEMYCDKGKVEKKEVLCSSGKCVDGKCLGLTSGTMPKPAPAVRKCKDDDSSKNPPTTKDNSIYKKSRTYFVDERGNRITGTIADDVCKDKKTLSERYCASSSSALTKNVACAKGCSSGACKK